ncbi:hypothetical protein Tco_0475582 [Tanacetum coccineum]
MVNVMYYPRFTKLIVNFFMSKDPSIPWRNKINWHYARDDPMFTTINVISRHEDTQLYGAILPKELTNEDIRNSESYKEYYAIASGEVQMMGAGVTRGSRCTEQHSIKIRCDGDNITHPKCPPSQLLIQEENNDKKNKKDDEDEAKGGDVDMTEADTTKDTKDAHVTLTAATPLSKSKRSSVSRSVFKFISPTTEMKHAEFDESNANVLERFYTSARNPVKEILLKLNLPDHRNVSGGEVKEFQSSFRHSDTERLSRSDEVLKLKNFKKDATLKLFQVNKSKEWSMSHVRY